MDAKTGKRISSEALDRIKLIAKDFRFLRALEFYADRDNYSDGFAVTPMDHDGGEIARIALVSLGVRKDG